MRFGKRNKTWSAVGRRFFGEDASNGPKDTESAAAAAPVREDTPEPELEEQVMAVEEAGVHSAGPVDPSQSLLISLGRFKKHIQRALGMPDNTHWPGECMRELVSMLHVALDHHWSTLQMALTDTARVLSSYEHAGRAASCLPFLRASDDALSMMIGDLIIDNETPTVRDAWRKHYQTALETMRREGIPLIEEEEEEPVSQPAQEAPVETAPAPPMEEARAEETVPETLPAVDSAPETPPDETPDTASPFEDAAPAPPPLAESLLPMPETPWDDVAPLEPSASGKAEMGGEGPSTPLDTPEPGACAGEGEKKPESDGVWEAALDAREEEGAPDIPPLEISGEDGALPETGAVPGEEAPAAPEPEPEPEPEPVKAPTLDEINRAMQTAMQSGDVAAARVLAIQLAAALAQQEADHVSAALEAARARLELNRETMGDAARRVEEAEQRVRNAEEQVAAREEEAQAARERITSLDGGVQDIQAEIEDLDGRIAELQRQRAEAAQRLQEREAERADTIAAESLVRAEIESLLEEEEAGGELLEAARRRVRDLAAGRDAVEEEILGLQRELERRRRAVGEISRPLAADTETDDGPDPAGDMLF